MYVEHEALNTAKEKMDKTISVFKRELSHIRAGRANPQLLDGIMVDYYGVPTPLQPGGEHLCAGAEDACSVWFGMLL